jgi:DNA mismatch repair protein MLH1
LNQSRKEKSLTQLTSIGELRAEMNVKCDQECDDGLREQIQKLKFVGLASNAKALIQCESILYLCDTQSLCMQLFYQQVITNFEHLDSVEIAEPLSIRQLALIGFDMKECAWEEEDGCKEELAKRVESLLVAQREMLREYFCITINGDCQLETLPSIVPCYSPLMSQLPLFIIRMATEVNYDDEKNCFKSIAEELANFYKKLSVTSSRRTMEYLMETIIYPGIRKKLLPPKQCLTDGSFLRLTSLQELYKVFERC